MADETMHPDGITPQHAARLATWRKYQEKNREKCRERSRAWKAKNRERALEITREWKAANPDAAKLWHVENREKSRAAVRNRAARRRSAEGTHTAGDLAKILKAQGYRCAYCRADLRKVKRHVDHIHALAAGGSNDRKNLQYLCAPCNQSKGAKHPIDFAQSLGRLL